MNLLRNLIALAILGLSLAAQAQWTPLPAVGQVSLPLDAEPGAIALASATRVLAVGTASPAGVVLVNPDSGAIISRIALSAQPRALAIDASAGKVYVIDDVSANSVKLLDVATATVVANWSLGGDLSALALTPSGNQLIAADRAGKKLLTIAVANGTLVRVDTLAGKPELLAFGKQGSRLLVGLHGGRLLTLDAATYGVLGELPTGDEIRGLAWWDDGDMALTVGKNADALNYLPGGTAVSPPATPISGNPRELSTDEVLDRAFVTTPQDMSVYRVELPTRQIAGRYPLPGRTRSLIFDPLARMLLLPLIDDRSLLRLDPQTATLVSPLLLGKGVSALAVNPVTHKAAVVADKAQELSRIDIGLRTAAILALPAKPRLVAIDSAIDRAVIAAGPNAKIVHFVDLATGALLPETILAEFGIEALAVDSTRGLALAVRKKVDGLLVIDTRNRAVITSIALDADYSSLAIHSARGMAYLGGRQRVTPLDLTTLTLGTPRTVAIHAEALAVDEVLDVLVATDRPTSSAHVFRLTDFSVRDVFTLPLRPAALAILPDTHVAVIASPESDALSTVNLHTGAVQAGFVSVEKPFALAVSQRYNQALVLSAKTDLLEFVQLPNPLPLFDTLNPNRAAVGSAALLLSVAGGNFVDGAKVIFGSTNLVTRWINSGRLEADLPASMLAAAGTFSVRVRNPAPAGGDSVVRVFEVLPPSPVLGSVSPTLIDAGSPDTALTLTGQNFTAASLVIFDGQTISSQFVSATQLIATVPASLLANDRTAAVWVLTVSGQSNTVNVVIQPTGPRITAFTPAAGPLGILVTITGTRFTVDGPAAVRFNGEPAVVASVSDTQITAIVPPRATTGPISVTSPRGTGTSATNFTVQPRQDFDILLSPNAVTAPLGGNAVLRISLASIGLAPYAHAATLQVTGLPAGVSAVLDRPNVFVGGPAILTLRADAASLSGTHNLTIVAIGNGDQGDITRSKPLSLTVLAAGATSVSGRVLHAEDDSPFIGARIRLGSAQVFTDAAGAYRFLSPPLLGDQVLLIDGNTANTPQFEFPSGIAMPVLIQAGQDNPVLTSYIGRVDATRFTTVAPGQAASVTDPELPNFSLNIPQGVSIIGWDGTPVTKISLRKVPIDRLPIRPVPEGIETRSVYLFYFFREGGGNPTSPVPVSLPNDLEALPGEQLTLYYYDESRTPDPNSNQWREMGLGTVSEDGKTVVSNPGVGIPKFCCGATFMGRSGGGATGRNGSGGQTCNPVDLASGNAVLFRPRPFGMSKFMSMDANCRYRSTDTRQGLFGRGFSFTYDWFAEQVGTAVRVTDPEGRQYMLAREADGIFRARSGRPEAIGWEVIPTATGRTLRMAEGTRYEFNTAGRLQAILDLSGNRISFEVDALGFPRSITDAGGQVYDFTLSGSLQSTRITRITDPAGRYLEFTYDGARRLITYRDQGGHLTQFAYDAAGRVAQVTDPRGAVKSLFYDASGRVIREVLPGGAEERFTYSGAGATVAETRYTNPNGHTTTPRFSGLAHPALTADALGRETRIERDPLTHLPLRITDPAGRLTQFSYNARGDLIRVVNTLGGQTLIDYDPRFRKPVRIEDALGQVTTLSYDAQGNLRSVTNAENQTATFTYTPRGQLETSTDPLGRITRFGHDPLGNPVSVTNPAGETVSSLHDQANRMSELTDALSRTSRFSYDDLDRITQVTDALGGLTTLAYDANDNLLSVTDPNNHPIERNVYDLRNRVTRSTDAANRDTLYDYDAASNLTKMTDRLGRVTDYSYDALNRLTRVSDPDGRVTGYQYDLAGNISKITDTVSGDILMRHDALDRLVEVISAQGVVGYGYDAIGRRIERTINGGDSAIYQYDRANRLTTITFRGQTTSYQYDAAGRLNQKTLPNGITQNFGYDTADRVTSIVYRRSDGAQIEALSYAYDAAGQRIAKTSDLGSAAETPFSATYDEANRLSAITFTGTSQNCTLAYDQNGNLSSKTCPFATTSYTWDAQDRLTAINGPGVTASFQYDAIGRRISRTVNGQTTAYLYDGIQAIAETRNGQVTTLLTGLEIDEMIARYTNANQRVFLTDALGSVIGQARNDQSIQNWYRYSPYGETVATADDEGNSSEYTARENDGTGLYYYRARYYDPVLTRFISEDPIGLDSGDTNFYAYVHGNPLSYADPSGNVVPFVAYLAWVAIQRAAGAAVFNIGLQYAGNLLKGQSMLQAAQCINVSSVLTAAGTGLIAPTQGVRPCLLPVNARGPRFDQIDILAQQTVDQFGELHSVLGGAPGELALHCAVEIDWELELRLCAVELPAHPFAEIIFVSLIQWQEKIPDPFFQWQEKTPDPFLAP